MKIFVTGASGLIGRHLVPNLESAGHQVVRLVRRPARSEWERQWDPNQDQLSLEVFQGADVVVHLAGENIGDGRWTKQKKQRIRESRVHGTQLIAEAISGLERPPRAFVVASAIGFYGDRGDEQLTESSPRGTGYLAEVCQAWEAAADPARERGIRCAHIRPGVVLSGEGGALAKMLLPFKLGLGGVIGSGKQFWSWIAVQDAARMFQFVAEHDSISGPVNSTAPRPVTNREFTKTLGRVLSRPTVLPMPAFAARMALGEMAEELILASTRVSSEVAQQHGFEFQFSELEPALRSLKL